jgi:hypothetical protein
MIKHAIAPCDVGQRGKQRGHRDVVRRKCQLQRGRVVNLIVIPPAHRRPIQLRDAIQGNFGARQEEARVFTRGQLRHDRPGDAVAQQGPRSFDKQVTELLHEWRANHHIELRLPKRHGSIGRAEGNFEIAHTESGEIPLEGADDALAERAGLWIVQRMEDGRDRARLAT